MGPADSRRIPRVPRYSGSRWASAGFGYGTLTLCGGVFQRLPLACLRAVSRPYNPGHAVTSPVWAPPSSLAATGGIILYFLFLRVLRCFSSPRSPPASAGFRTFSTVGCPIRTSADQRLHAPTRGFSQLAASFIACKSLGIRRAPFDTSDLALHASHDAGGADFHAGVVHTSSPLLFSCVLVFQYVNDLAPHSRRHVENNGLEPLTPCLQGRRSSQLS